MQGVLCNVIVFVVLGVHSSEVWLVGIQWAKARMSYTRADHSFSQPLDFNSLVQSCSSNIQKISQNCKFVCKVSNTLFLDHLYTWVQCLNCKVGDPRTQTVGDPAVQVVWKTLALVSCFLAFFLRNTRSSPVLFWRKVCTPSTNMRIEILWMKYERNYQQDRYQNWTRNKLLFI